MPLLEKAGKPCAGGPWSATADVAWAIKRKAKIKAEPPVAQGRILAGPPRRIATDDGGKPTGRLNGCTRCNQCPIMSNVHTDRQSPHILVVILLIITTQQSIPQLGHLYSG